MAFTWHFRKLLGEEDERNSRHNSSANNLSNSNPLFVNIQVRVLTPKMQVCTRVMHNARMGSSPTPLHRLLCPPIKQAPHTHDEHNTTHMSKQADGIGNGQAPAGQEAEDLESGFSIHKEPLRKQTSRQFFKQRRRKGEPEEQQGSNEEQLQQTNAYVSASVNARRRFASVRTLTCAMFSSYAHT